MMEHASINLYGCVSICVPVFRAYAKLTMYTCQVIGDDNSGSWTNNFKYKFNITSISTWNIIKEKEKAEEDLPKKFDNL